MFNQVVYIFIIAYSIG